MAADPQELVDALQRYARFAKDLKIEPTAAALVVVAAELRRIADALEAQNP